MARREGAVAACSSSCVTVLHLRTFFLLALGWVFEVLVIRILEIHRETFCIQFTLVDIYFY